MNKLIAWLSGKKTYIAAIIIGLLAAAQALGIIIPEWVYALLAAAGLGAVRASIAK
jgi:small-conductance mechanosensitive channel